MMRISRESFELLLGRFRKAWGQSPPPPASRDFRPTLEKRLLGEGAGDPFTRLEEKFRKSLDQTPLGSDSYAFQCSVMKAVEAIPQEVTKPTEGIDKVLSQFQRALLLTSEPLPDVEFRHRVMTKIRREPRFEEEPSILDITMEIAEGFALSLCSVTVLVTLITFTQTSLFSTSQVEYLMLLAG